MGSHLDGLEVLTEIERQVESLKTVHSFLAVADDGASWSEIGRRFGVTGRPRSSGTDATPAA